MSYKGNGEDYLKERKNIYLEWEENERKTEILIENLINEDEEKQFIQLTKKDDDAKTEKEGEEIIINYEKLK